MYKDIIQPMLDDWLKKNSLDGVFSSDHMRYFAQTELLYDLASHIFYETKKKYNPECPSIYDNMEYEELKKHYINWLNDNQVKYINCSSYPINHHPGSPTASEMLLVLKYAEGRHRKIEEEELKDW